MTDHDVDFLPTLDPLARDPRLEYGVELPVLGVDTHFQTNSRYVLGVVEETFGAWRGLGQSPGRESERVSVRVVVHDGVEHGPGHALVRHLCPDATRVIVHSPGSVGISDPARRESVAYVTTALASDRAHFRVAMLEAITFALLAHFDRHPIHAASIARDGRAMLLAGPSGAGKSTLAYMAHTAGVDVLSEDHVWVQLTPAVRVWGAGGRSRARLMPDVSAHFPEVERTGVASDLDGKRKLVVDLDASGGLVYAADCAGVCILEKGSGAPALERLEAEAIVSALSGPAAGFDRFPERHIDVVRALARYGGWRLTLSTDPRDALPLLIRMLDAS